MCKQPHRLINRHAGRQGTINKHSVRNSNHCEVGSKAAYVSSRVGVIHIYSFIKYMYLQLGKWMLYQCSLHYLEMLLAIIYSCLPHAHSITWSKFLIKSEFSTVPVYSCILCMIVPIVSTHSARHFICTFVQCDNTCCI